MQLSSKQVAARTNHAAEYSDALQSWKEIAAYLKRTVRSVQRWECNAGLPVRRMRAGDRGAVLAFRSEIDRWLHSRPTRME
jgi:hypothetical protein